MTAPERDPFAGSDSAPAISFKDQPPGTVHRIIADGPAKMLQQRVFGSDGELAFWPGKNGQPGNPKMAAVVNGTDPTTGEPCSLWAPIPSDMQAKVLEAQKSQGAGYRIKAGDEIAVKLIERVPSGKGSPKSVYAVKITPGAAPKPAQADPFGNGGGDPWGSGDDAPPF